MNARRPDSRYPDPRLTGAGVAFKLAQLLLEDGSPASRARWLELADLATIGTVADVAPLLGENRAIARLGLELLRRNARPGLAALIRVAGLAPDRIDAESVAYSIAPRLNAAGRIGEVTLAARLLLASDAGEADELAGQLEEANRTRRDLTAVALAEARDAVGDPGESPAIVVAGPWPVGLIGLVAGRLAETHRRPVVVFSTDAEPWRGSARAPSGGLDLARAFGSCERHFVRYGGHPEAAGCDLLPGAVDAFRADFQALAALAPSAVPQPPLPIDLVVQVLDVDYALFHELERLEPFGAGNPRTARGRPRRDRDARPPGLERARADDGLEGTRGAGRHRIRTRGPGRRRSGGRPGRHRGEDRQPAVRGLRIFAAGACGHRDLRGVGSCRIARGRRVSGNRLPRRVARQRDGDGSQRPPGRRTMPGIASLLSAVGLVVVAVLSYGLLGGPLPDIIPIRELHPGDVPNRTPNPVVVYTPVAAQPPHVVGTILFVKAGNIWSVSGDDQLTRLTSGGTDQTPTWSPDGKTIYFVRLLSKKTQVPCSYIAAGGCVAGSAVNYTLEYPVLSSMADAPGGGCDGYRERAVLAPCGRPVLLWTLAAVAEPGRHNVRAP